MKKYIVTVLGLMLAPAMALACSKAPTQHFIQVAKILEGGKTTIAEGTTATYIINVTNQLSVPDPNVSVIDFAPAGFQFISGSPECKGSGNIVTCTISTVPATGTVSLKLTFAVPTGACPAGKIVENRVALQPPHSTNTVGNAKIFDIHLAACVAAPASAPEPEKPKKGEANIDIEKKVSHRVTRPGHTVTYTLTVTNTGEQELNNVMVSDSLSKAFEKITVNGESLKGNTFTVSDKTLKPKGTLKYEIKATVVKKDSVCGTDIKNVATAEDLAHGVKDTAETNTDVQCVKAAVVAPRPIAPVAVTARTGAGSLAMVVTLLGAAGLGVTRRLFS